MKNQHPLDDLIRQRLDSLPAPPPRGWDALRDKLDDPTAAIDSLIAGKLASLPATAPPSGSWQALESKVTAAELRNDRAVDRAVARQLEKTAPTSPSGWALLASRLELTGRRREMIACVKIAEAALLMSLLLLALRFGPTPPPSPTKPLAHAGTPGLSAFPVAEPSPAATGRAAQDDRPAAGSDEAAEPSISTPKRARAISPLDGPAPAPPRSVTDRSVTDRLPQIERTQTAPAAPPLITLSGDVRSRYEPSVRPALDFASLLEGQPIRYYLNVFASPTDLNQVITPRNDFIGVAERQSNFSTGYTLGALIDIVQGHNAIQTGALFSYRSYVPVAFGLIQGEQPLLDGEEPVRFGRLRYRTVSIPLSYSRQFHQNEKWRFSGGLGMAMNVILNSDFKLANNLTLDDLDRFWQEYLAQGREKGTVENIGRSSEYTDLLTPPQGYLEGGSLIKNTSLYLTGNLTIERLLNDRWSLYFSPTVMRQFTVRDTDGGKGPLQDRIHSTNFRLGTRLRLTDK